MLTKVPYRYVHDKKAGNFHDVWKHFILAEYMRERATNYDLNYIDTHGGAFVYRNDQFDQLSTGLLNVEDPIKQIPESAYKEILLRYQAKIELNTSSRLNLVYPGSLAIASYFMHQGHGAVYGCEINNSMANKCSQQMSLFKEITKTKLNLKCVRNNGFHFANNFINAHKNAEGVIFVDPPYYPNEHQDWEAALTLLKTVLEVSRNWTYILWYCVYTNDPDSHIKYVNKAMSLLGNYAAVSPSLNISLQIRPLDEKYGKSVTGMLIVNPKIQLSYLTLKFLQSGLNDIAAILKPKDISWGPQINIQTMGV